MSRSMVHMWFEETAVRVETWAEPLPPAGVSSEG